MSNESDLITKLDTISDIDEKDVKQPGMPVSIFIKEGEDLYDWCLADKEVLVAKGLEWEMVEDLPSCLGALREVQTKWNAELNSREEADKSWDEKAPAAYDLRDMLLHDFRYAYRTQYDILGHIAVIAEGSGHSDLIRDLNDLAVLGKENPAALVAINFDRDLLGVAAKTADILNELLAIVNGDRREQSEAKTLRDKAYTLCKGMIDEIRACGQYAFWRSPERVKGYTSAHTRKMHGQNK